MLVGIALEQRKIRSLDQTVDELLPEAAAKVPTSAVNGVTLAQKELVRDLRSDCCAHEETANGK
jgi:hypothetical protein